MTKAIYILLFGAIFSLFILRYGGLSLPDITFDPLLFIILFVILMVVMSKKFGKTHRSIWKGAILGFISGFALLIPIGLIQMIFDSVNLIKYLDFVLPIYCATGGYCAELFPTAIITLFISISLIGLVLGILYGIYVERRKLEILEKSI